MGTLTRLGLGAALTTAMLAAAGCSNNGTASTPDLAMTTQDLATGTDSGGYLFPDIGPLADITGSPVVRLSGGFAQPFGAFYDTATSSWYVSNVAGDLSNFQKLKDGQGWITKISADYKTVDHAFFATGLNAPAGLRVVGGQLYVPDVDQLVVIDVMTKAVVRSATVTPASPFVPYVIMTDVVVDSAGVAYSPETIGSRILKFATPLVAGAASTSYRTSGASYTFPTTLYIDNTDAANAKLVLGTTGNPMQAGATNNLFTMKLADGSGLAQLGTFAANFQGIEMDGTNYLVGTTRTHTVNKIAATGGASTVLLDDAQQGGVSVSDIGWDATRRILAVPDTGTNCVYFYQM